jgi:hypothetical protein
MERVSAGGFERWRLWLDVHLIFLTNLVKMFTVDYPFVVWLWPLQLLAIAGAAFVFG